MSAELDKAYARWKATGSAGDRALLMRALEPTVQSALTSYGGGDKSLATRARIMAAQALEKYDPEKAALQTHVHSQLRGLYRVRGERQNAVHVPETTRLDRLHVQAFMDEWKDRHGHEPDDLTIAEGLRVSKGRVRRAMGLAEMSGSMAQGEKGDAAGSVVRSPRDVWMDYVYHDLDPRGRKIMEWSWGYGGAKVKPVNEIADKLKVSAAAISQRRGTIMKRLNEVDEVPGLAQAV